MLLICTAVEPFRVLAFVAMPAEVVFEHRLLRIVGARVI